MLYLCLLLLQPQTFVDGIQDYHILDPKTGEARYIYRERRKNGSYSAWREWGPRGAYRVNTQGYVYLPKIGPVRTFKKIIADPLVPLKDVKRLKLEPYTGRKHPNDQRKSNKGGTSSSLNTVERFQIPGQSGY